MDPEEEVGIAGAVVPDLAGGGGVFPLNVGVHAIHSGGLGADGVGGGEGGDGEPADGAGEAAEGICLVAGVVAHAGEAAGVEGLHEEGADAADEGGEVCVDDPGCLVGEEEAGVIAGVDFAKPWGDAIWVSGEEDAEAFPEVFLEAVAGQGGGG